MLCDLKMGLLQVCAQIGRRRFNIEVHKFQGESTTVRAALWLLPTAVFGDTDVSDAFHA
jgi:hypothetical protein